MNSAKCVSVVTIVTVWALWSLVAGPLWAQEAAPDAGEAPNADTGPIPSTKTPDLPNEQPAANAATPEGKTLSLDFKDADMIEVIKSIGKFTGRNFDVPADLAQQKVTVISHEEVPVELAYQVLESILGSRGYSLVETLDGKLVKIVAVPQLRDKWPMVTGEKVPTVGHDTWSTHVVPVHNVTAEEVAQLLTEVGSEKAMVRTFVKTNTLVISDTVDGVANMLSLLEQLDIPGYATTMEMFVLKYADATSLATLIQDVMLGAEGTVEGAGGAPRPPRPAPRQVRPRPGAPPQPTSVVAGTREETLRLVPYESLNALIVVAAESVMNDVRSLIDMLDKPLEYEDRDNNFHVRLLQNADGERLAEDLTKMFGGVTPQRKGGQSQQAPEQAQTVQAFEKEVQITWYKPRNALLILASPQDYQRVEQIIAQLDMPPRQVHVEAAILEVVITNKFELSVEAADLTANDAFALNNVVKLANIISQGALAAGGPGVTAGVLDGTTQITVPGGEAGPTLATIPNIPFLLTALEKITDVDVLSQPFVTTKDNEEATFDAVKDVPTVGQFSNAQSGTTDQSRLYSTSVSRAKVGVKLKVKPQISEGDYVAMELFVEVSDTTEGPVGIDPGVLGPTFKESAINNKVVIKDGCTGILGGLISESKDHGISQTPLLGDLPFFGWLFRSKASNMGKRNLVVLVTPHIIKEGHDLDRVTSAKLDEFRTANADMLFEKGFIKKIKRKRELRTERGPTQAAVEKLQRGENLQRGSIPR